MQTGKAKRNAIKGNTMLVRLKLKYSVLFQVPQVEKEFENLVRVNKTAWSLENERTEKR